MQEGERDGDDEKCKFAGKVPKARAENFAKVTLRRRMWRVV
jgi:hypothetical protein